MFKRPFDLGSNCSFLGKMNLEGGAMRLLVFVVLLGLTACHSGWDKDAFAKEEDRIKKATQKDEEVPKIPPPRSNSVFISMDHVYTVTEGGSLEIPITWKEAHKEVTVTSVKVHGLEEKFPGAKFIDVSKKEKKIVIEPGYDYVAVEDDYDVQYLTISFYNQYQGQEQELKRTIAIHVVPENTTIPRVENVFIELLNDSPTIKPGETRKITVLVHDENKEYSPRIKVFNDASQSNPTISQFLNLEAEGEYDKDQELWVFKGQISIPPLFYMMENKMRTTLDFYAYSITGVPSRVVKKSVSLSPVDILPPVIMAQENILANVDDLLQYTVIAYDVRGQATPGLKCSSKPVGFVCSCNSTQTNIGRQAYCNFRWTPKKAGPFKVKIVGTNTVGFGNNKQVETTELEMTLTVRN